MQNGKNPSANNFQSPAAANSTAPGKRVQIVITWVKPPGETETISLDDINVVPRKIEIKWRPSAKAFPITLNVDASLVRERDQFELVLTYQKKCQNGARAKQARSGKSRIQWQRGQTRGTAEWFDADARATKEWNGAAKKVTIAYGTADVLGPENLAFTSPEGKQALVTHLKRERSATLVRLFKEGLNDFRCVVCGFDFGKVYGGLGENFIEAHHIKQVAHMKHGEKSALHELRAVCSNCHRMVHQMSPAMSVEKLKRIVSKMRLRQQ